MMYVLLKKLRKKDRIPPPEAGETLLLPFGE